MYTYFLMVGFVKFIPAHAHAQTRVNEALNAHILYKYYKFSERQKHILMSSMWVSCLKRSLVVSKLAAYQAALYLTSTC